MRMKNVQEMPIHHTTMCKPGDEEIVLSYNANDVISTYQFLLTAIGKTNYSIYKGKNKIDLRLKLKKKFGISCLNWPDVKIGEQLILKLYADKMNTTIPALKAKGGTKRNIIHLKECIPHWANFETKEFNEIKNKFASTSITSIKNAFEESVYFHGIRIDYGTGGAHSAAESSVYSADDYWTILDEDIGSLYPSIAIQLGIYPEHLGKEFLEIYDKDIVSVRLAEKKKEKKNRDMVIMEGYKLAANGIYGKSGEESSALYDPLYTMKTTIGGQMFLSMWTEKLVKAIPEIKFLAHNTDGITYLLPRRDVIKAKQVGKEMSELTGLYIEDNMYSKVILRDVNNYIAVYDDSTKENEHVKLKGCFEIDKEYHKDPSMRIVPIALKEYFVNGVPIRDTILNHKDIFDFCLRLKVNSKSVAKYVYFDNGLKEQILPRTTRYYISNNGGNLYKDLGENRITGVNVGYTATLFNNYEEKPMEDYNINYSFYINEAMKIVNVITEGGQLKLF
jgi:hypothetical protein